MIRLDEVPQLMGAAVHGPDGSKIGSAGQVYLDDHTGEPEWVCVRTGLFGRKESFVPLSDAAFTGDRLEIPFDKDRVKGAPHVDPDGDLTPADEDELYAYYGMASGGGVPGDTYDRDTSDGDTYDRDASSGPRTTMSPTPAPTRSVMTRPVPPRTTR
jgi:sporulation protein YlmC with PRC-barrel domain